MLQARCAQHAPGRTHYSPNVADFEHFSAARQAGPIPSDLEAILRPRIGFIGAVSEYKVDFDLIAAVADARPDWHWVLIGQLGEGQPGTSAAKLRRPNIHLLGPRPYDALPGYLRGFDVAVLPCPLNAYTRAMSPMKFFEYLAAGRPIVATPVDGIMEYRESFWPAESPDRVPRGHRTRARWGRSGPGDRPSPCAGEHLGAAAGFHAEGYGGLVGGRRVNAHSLRRAVQRGRRRLSRFFLLLVGALHPFDSLRINALHSPRYAPTVCAGATPVPPLG